MEPDPRQVEHETSQLIQAVRELRSSNPAGRIVIVAPGEAATAQVQTQLALAGELGVTVCGPEALLPNLLQAGSRLAASRVRTPGYWRELVAKRYGVWNRSRQHELAVELFTADLLPLTLRWQRAARSRNCLPKDVLTAPRACLIR